MNRHKYELFNLMDPVAGLADFDDIVDQYFELGELDEPKYKSIIEREFVPYYRKINKDDLVTLKNDLETALNDDDYDFERDFECVLPPFDPPENPRDFFVWIDEAIQKILAQE